MLESPGLFDFIISMVQLDFSSAHWLPEKSGDCGELATTAELLRHPQGCSSRSVRRMSSLSLSLYLLSQSSVIIFDPVLDPVNTGSKLNYTLHALVQLAHEEVARLVGLDAVLVEHGVDAAVAV